MGNRTGIKLVAHLPISKTTVTDTGDQPDQGGVEFLNQSRTHFLVRQGYFDDMTNPFNVDFDVYGRGFKYDSPFPGAQQVPVEGKIRSIDVRIGDQLGLELSSLDLGVPRAANLFAKDDPLAAFAKLLVGDDTIIGSEFDDPNIWGGKGNDLMWGRMGNDIVNGFKGNDTNDGGLGNDYLTDTRGKDWFQFSTGLQTTASLNLNHNFDIIKKFGEGDNIYLAENVFEGIGGKLSKNEFHFGDIATSTKQRILFDGDVGYWDRDGSGSMYEAIPFFQVENGAGNINHKVFVMGVMYGDGY